MKLKCSFLLLLYYGLICCQEVNAENASGIKRGMHPYMAFIYYSDPSITDVSGQRYVRSAVLIRPDWLITTAIGPSLMDPPNGFPKKTLLARAGAVSIDTTFTLNEDEDEQEREIIQIVRPYNHSATQWWTTDISLLKTLLPFNITSAVDVKPLTLKRQDIDSKVCSILVYARKYSNATEEKNLMVLFVDMLPPSINNCGSHFTMNTMACAADSADNKDAVYDADFCQGNSGGPLICDTEVVGLQTYIGNDCKQPHLYQLLSAWEKFITCGIEDKCKEDDCTAICDVVLKDPPENILITTDTAIQDTFQDLTEKAIEVSSTTSNDMTDLVNLSDSSHGLTDLANLSDLTSLTQTTTVMIETFASSEILTQKTEPVTISDVSLTSEEASTTTVTSVDIDENPTTNFKTSMEALQEILTTTLFKDIFQNLQTRTEEQKENYETMSTRAIDEISESYSKFITLEKIVREELDDFTTKKERRIPKPHRMVRKSVQSTSKGNMCVIQTVVFGFLVLVCL